MKIVKKLVINLEFEESECPNHIINELKEKYGAIDFVTRQAGEITKDSKCFFCGNNINKELDNYCSKCGAYLQI